MEALRVCCATTVHKLGKSGSLVPTGLATALCMWLDSSDRIFDQYLISIMAVEGRVRDDDRTEQGELKRKAKF